MILSLVLTLLAAGQAGAPPADPLAPARSGQLQCFGPDTAHRTCKSMGGYSFAPDGGITNQAQVLIAPQGPLVMLTASAVVVRDGAVCGPIRAQDIDQSQILMAGRPLGGVQAERLKTQLKGQLGQMIGSEVCTRLVPDANGFTTQVTVNGRVAPPDASAAMIWVGPNDGWTVAP
jgi:hypothetical protein